MASLVVGGVSYYAWTKVGGPLVVGGAINPLPALAAGGMALAALSLTTDALGFIANLCGYAKARIPTGRKGTAAFGRFRDVRKSLIEHGWGAYFGVADGKPVFPKLEAAAYVLGPTGVGKTSKIVLPGILALRDQPQIFYDYKSDITPQVARVLRGGNRRLFGRRIERRLRIINLGGLYETEVGQETDTYNLLILIVETFFRERGLEDVTDTVRELCFVLDPDDAGKSDVSNGSFWKSNSRRLIGFVILIVVLTEGENGTLGHCLQMLNDKQSLLRHALWAAGRLATETVDEFGEVHTAFEGMPLHEAPWASLHDPLDVANFAEFLRALASGIADVLSHPDGKLADSMLSSARESALSSFDITSRANKLTSKTTFRFSETKDEGSLTSVAIMINPNKLAAHTAVLGVLHWAMLAELRQHERKTRKVHVWVDEAGNLPWPRIADDLTTLRGYGVVPILAFQNYAHFAARHGKVGLESLLSEAQVALALPGQRSPETLKMLEARLSQESVIARSHNANSSSGAFSMDGYGLQEEAKPLLSAEEIRRLDKGILWIGNNKPLLVDLPSVAAIHPFRKELDPSPFTGKPYLEGVKFRIKPYPRSLLSYLGGALKFLFTAGRSSS